jgi:hypothetical protein
MASIKELIQSIESGDSSFDEKLAAINQMEETLIAMRNNEEQAVNDNVELIVEAIKVMEKKVNDQLEIAKSIVPEKGDKGDRGLDGAPGRDGVNGRDGRDGKDGQNGQDGADGVSVTDAKIDFDGSLIITLSTGREINVGEVVASDLAEKIKVISTMSTNTAIADITGGTINNTVIGGTTPAAGTFTTLTATGQTSLGGAAGSESLRVALVSSAVNYIQVNGAATGTSPSIQTLGSSNTQFLNLYGRGTAGGTNIGSGTTTQFAVRGVSGSATVNYLQANGSTTSTAPILSAQGSDTNISQVFQSKGTGAIDLAAGSSGVNISNGGTVTAITRTVSGSGYTSVPSAVISAPTTAGGTQATLSPSMTGVTATVVAGGTGYTVGDTLTIVGATGTASQLTVATLSGSAVATVTFAVSGNMTALPTNPVSVTGGTGTGATFTMTYALAATQSSFTAGSGYVEQPTVTFSGSGGSGAAAYATVGSTQIVRGLNDISFYSPGGEALRILDRGIGSLVNYAQVSGSTTTNAVRFSGQGSDTNVPVFIGSKGTSQVSTYTNNFATEQFRVSHTASAVNYVQVTGAATGGNPSIQTAGSDANRGLSISSKGTSAVGIYSGAGTYLQFQVVGTNSAVNYLQAIGTTAGNSPSFAVAGSDTNIDLTLTPKGTGVVQFGTYTATVTAVAGYILIKDSGGTTRKLAVLT